MGTDELKTAVVSQNLDIALVYSGDFFDQYYFLLETERKSPLICICRLMETTSGLTRW